MILIFPEPSFYATFIAMLISANLLTYSQSLCVSLCSALTTSLVGVGKSVIQTIIGFFTFGGVQFHPLNVAGTKKQNTKIQKDAQ